MLWQIFLKIGGNLSIWEWDILSLPLVAICYTVYGHTDRYVYSEVELTVNQVTYKYVPWYHLLSQCLQQSIRTVISLTLSVSTAVNKAIHQNAAVRYNSWLRWNAMNLCFQQTVTRFSSSDVWRPSRSEVQFLRCGWFLYVQLSLLKASEVNKNLPFIGQGKINIILLTEWQE